MPPEAVRGADAEHEFDEPHDKVEARQSAGGVAAGGVAAGGVAAGGVAAGGVAAGGVAAGGVAAGGVGAGGVGAGGVGAGVKVQEVPESDHVPLSHDAVAAPAQAPGVPGVPKFNVRAPPELVVGADAEHELHVRVEAVHAEGGEGGVGVGVAGAGVAGIVAHVFATVVQAERVHV